MLATLLFVCMAATTADKMLDEPPRVRGGPIITPTVAKSIVGQAALQLSVMAALLGPLGETLTHHGPAVTGAAAAVADAAAGAGAAMSDAAVAAAAAAMSVGVDGAPERIEQYTLVFNSFVLMQLFNQVRGSGQCCDCCVIYKQSAVASTCSAEGGMYQVLVTAQLHKA